MGNGNRIPALGLFLLAMGIAHASEMKYNVEESTVTLRMQHIPLGRFDTISKAPLGITIQISDEKATVLPATLLVPTRSLESTIKLRDDHIYQILEAEKFPSIEFTGLSVQLKEKTFIGNLKVKDITHAVAGTFKLNAKKTNVTLEFNDDLANFKITPPTYAGVGVKPEFKIIVEAALKSAE